MRIFRIRTRRIIWMVMMLLAIHDRVDAQTSTPTPIPVDAGGMIDSLQDANTDITGVGSDLSAPGGIPLLPDVTGSEVFRYAKWLLSPSSADELVGPFAPLITHTGVFIGLLIGTAGIYVLIYAAVYLIKFVVWIFKMIVLLIDSVVSVVGSIFKFFF